jgi:hypothetical protein
MNNYRFESVFLNQNEENDSFILQFDLRILAKMTFPRESISHVEGKITRDR